MFATPSIFAEWGEGGEFADAHVFYPTETLRYMMRGHIFCNYCDWWPELTVYMPKELE